MASAPFPGFTPQVGGSIVYMLPGMPSAVRGLILQVNPDGSCLVTCTEWPVTITEADVRRAWDHGQAMIDRHNLRGD